MSASSTTTTTAEQTWVELQEPPSSVVSARHSKQQHDHHHHPQQQQQQKYSPALASSSKPGESTSTTFLPKATFAPGGSSHTNLSNTHNQDNDALSLPSSSSLPQAAVPVLERWNHPRHNTLRIAAAFWSLLTMGAQDALSGALVTYMAAYYTLSYTAASLIFLSPFVGYTAAAATNNWVHMRLGQRGIAGICSACHLVAYLVSSLHPPYPVLVVFYALAGFGTGLGDAGWNSWVGGMDQANELLGIMHACYGLGATLSPLIATAMITKLGAAWYDFYYVMIGAAVIEGGATLSAFWTCTGKVFRESHEQPQQQTLGTSASGSPEGARRDSRMRDALLRMPAARVTWTVAIFMLCYVGAEVSLGGWIVNFMLVVRHGEAFASGMVATGFWLGLTLGRVILGFVTPRLGERLALLIYIPAVMGLQLLFWLVPQFYVSAVAIALEGFFLGPLFPGAIVAATKSLPKHLHTSAIGFAVAFGGSGAAVLPFAVGAIAQAKGVRVLQPIVLALLAVLLVLWLSLPRFSKKKE